MAKLIIVDNKKGNQDAYKVFETLEYLGIEIITHNLYPNFQAIKKEYEIHLALSSKERAFNAIQNDLRTILYLSTRDYHYNESGVYEEPYLLTWDSSFYYIRKILMNQKKGNVENQKKSRHHFKNSIKCKN